MSKPATFRVINFTKVGRFVAVAWNYDLGVLLGTSDHETYTAARTELQRLADERGVQLRWFDGEYDCAGEGAFLTPTVSRSHNIDGWPVPGGQP